MRGQSGQYVQHTAAQEHIHNTPPATTYLKLGTEGEQKGLSRPIEAITDFKRL